MNELKHKAWCPICGTVTTHIACKCTEHMIETKTSNSTSECPVCRKVINQCECKAPPIFTGEQYAHWLKAVELLQDVADSGVEHVAHGYVTVQINEGTWKEIQLWRKGEARE